MTNCNYCALNDSCPGFKDCPHLGLNPMTDHDKTDEIVALANSCGAATTIADLYQFTNVELIAFAESYAAKETVTDKAEIAQLLNKIEQLKARLARYEQMEPVAHMVIAKNRLHLGAMYRSREEALLDGLADWEIDEVIELIMHPKE